MYMEGGKEGVHGSNAKKIVISKIYKIPVRVCFFFAYEGQITQPLPLAVIKL
jgi:hypothetical protein